MFKTSLVAVGMALIASSAWSQSSWRDSSDRGWQGGDRYGGPERRGGWSGDREESMRGDRGGERPGGWGGDREDSMGSSRDEHVGRGARFTLQTGDWRLSVACDPRETARACVDSALTLFDRVRSQQGAAAPSSAPAAPPSPQ
jgi:hypothetical protein